MTPQRPLPDGWRWVRLGDYVTKIGSGVTPTGGYRSYLAVGIPLIRSQNVHFNRFARDGLAYISQDQDTAMNGSRVFPRDVLLNITGASIGRICVVPGEVCPANVNQHVSIIRCNEQLNPEFLSFYVSTPDFQRFIIGTQAGATRQALTKTQIAGFEIPLPPLHEQRRIAAMLAEQMTIVEQARAATEARLAAADALPAAFLSATFSSDQVRQWPLVELGKLLKLRKDVVHPRDKPRGFATFVGLEHIAPNTGVRTGSATLDLGHLSGRKPQFQRGDIVYGYLRPYLNKVWIAEFDGLCSVDQYVYKIATEDAETSFIAWFMRSPAYLANAPISSTPGQLPRIRTEEVASVRIPLPGLTDQRRILATLDERMSSGEGTRRALRSELASIAALPAALLRRAFQGS